MTKAAVVTLAAYDAQERQVATLREAQPRSVGEYTVPFATRGLAAGLYYYRLEAQGRPVSRPLSIVR
ncbi:hypothetical protein GCM10022408_34880 [Hymenobacter fastidiosus]|uniref:T9SS type A sorting domain-containing protein n=1 Tax=Hymenobacter fastidiosus TaxID=486264 RepID=A0ABP7SYA9_9BACT